MTQVTIAPRAPGWYPDPRGATLLLGLQHDAQLAVLRSTVINQAAGEGVRLSEVTCPADADLRSGAFTCDAVRADGAHLTIAVRIGSGGAVAWRASRG